MTLSICIPVYNFDVRNLVNDLHREISDKDLDAEIILIDDCSEKKNQQINAEIQEKTTQYIILEKNIGRSKIRNLFLKYSSGESLLFLDCDAKIISKNFVEKYINIIEKEVPQVIFGGFKENEIKGNLRSKYSKEREIKPLAERIASPYETFRGINFVVRRDVFEEVPFEESITGYGYEDYVFAQSLKRNLTKISHIDNPVIHLDESSNEEFLQKVEAAIQTLSALLKNKEISTCFQEMKLIKVFNFLQKTKGDRFFAKIFRKQKSRLRKKLLTGKVNLRYLDFYKLGVLVEKFQNS